MSKRLWFVLSVTLTASVFLAACEPTAAPTTAPTAVLVQAATPMATAERVQMVTVPTATTALLATPTLPTSDASMKVGLVTETSGIKDQAFNQLAWQGVQQAAQESGLQATFIESSQPSDYATNIDALAAEGYNVIITVGSMMAEATASKARQYPHIKFAIIDHAHAAGDLPNVTSLMFAEEQAGFLAGVLAGGMSQSGFVCSISSLKTPTSDRVVMSYRAGAVWLVGEDIQGMNTYINLQTTDPNIPNSIDPTQGKETAQGLIGAGCDVVFGVAADGALLASKENNLMAIGFNADQYNTVPDAKSALMSSVQKNVDVAVYNYLNSVIDGSVKSGISLGTLQNGGVGLAPFHDWDSKIPADLKSRLQQASEGLKNGSIALPQ